MLALYTQACGLPATPERMRVMKQVVSTLNKGKGYDVHWDAWELLTKAIAMEDA